MKTSEPKKRPVGRPRLDPSGTQETKPVKLTPAECIFLRKTYGSVNAGVRALVTQAMAR